MQEKLGDTVLERGILLPHPQGSYEVLEERLFEALELPVRHRARILKCGHYLGPDALASSTEDDSDNDSGIGSQATEGKRWCDICGREVKFEAIGPEPRGRSFNVKVYASNGLMRAGAWAAAWKEMERVDVEIEPFVRAELLGVLEEFAVACEQGEVDGGELHQEEDFVDEAAHAEEHDQGRFHEEESQRGAEQEELRRRQAAVDEEERKRNEERMREVYGSTMPATDKDRPRSSHSHTASVRGEGSLPELLLAAFKVAMQDRRNVVIGLLSIIVIFLALKSGSRQVTHMNMPEAVNCVLESVLEVDEVIQPCLPAATSEAKSTQVTPRCDAEVQEAAAPKRQKKVLEAQGQGCRKPAREIEGEPDPEVELVESLPSAPSPPKKQKHTVKKFKPRGVEVSVPPTAQMKKLQVAEVETGIVEYGMPQTGKDLVPEDGPASIEEEEEEEEEELIEVQ